MKDDIYLREKQKYTQLWSSTPEYREASAADLLAPAFLSYFSTQIQPGHRVLDFGCGAGRSALPLLAKGLHVDLIDFAEPCLWDLPASLSVGDWIICFDVLEHLPEEKIRSSLEGMAKRMKRGGLFSIDLATDRFGSQIGDTLHLTLKPKDWWHAQVSAFFSILEELAGGEGCLVYALAPKWV